MLKNSETRFGIVKYKVLSDPCLSIQAKGLYSLIACYADKNREAYPSASTLADSMDVSQRYLFKLLKDDATVSGLVGTRIYPSVKPQSGTFPCIIYTRTNGNWDYHFKGSSGLIFSRLQILMTRLPTP